MTEVERRQVRVGDLDVRVELMGRGDPVLLLHGFPDTLGLWRGVAPRLAAAGFRAIAPDLRGYGETGAPASRSAYRIERMVDDATGLLRALGIDGPVHVVGHDWGAALAWVVATLRPASVRSAVAISVGHPSEYARAGFEQKVKGLYVLGFQFPGLTEYWLARNDYASLRHWLRSHPDPEECVRNMARPGRLTAGLNWYRANLGKVLLGRWPPCRVPVLGIWSTDDDFLAEDQMQRSARRMAAPWRYERIDGAGHWLPLERPDQIASLAIEWFERRQLL